MLRLLKPLAPTLKELVLNNNPLGRTITADIQAFVNLTKLELAGMLLEGMLSRASTTAETKQRTITCAGPPLKKVLRLLAPLAPTLQELDLSENPLGGTITADVLAFTKLTDLGVRQTGLGGERAAFCNS